MDYWTDLFVLKIIFMLSNEICFDYKYSMTSCLPSMFLLPFVEYVDKVDTG